MPGERWCSRPALNTNDACYGGFAHVRLESYHVHAHNQLTRPFHLAQAGREYRDGYSAEEIEEKEDIS